MIGPRISYSAAQDLKTCPARYAYSFSDTPKMFQESLHLGEALHKVFSSTLKQDFSGYTPDFAEVYASLKRALWQAPEEVTIKTLKLLLAEGQPRLDVFVHQLLERLQGLNLELLETEKWFKIVVQDAAGDVLLTGRMDALFRDSKSNYIILDFKTGKHSPDATFPQLATYIAAARAIYGEDAIVKAYAVFLEGKTTFELYDESDYEKDIATLLIIARLGYSLEKFPKNQGSHCSYCPYQKTCFKELDLAKQGQDEKVLLPIIIVR
jgi:RecB family exonuclease